METNAKTMRKLMEAIVEATPRQQDSELLHELEQLLELAQEHGLELAVNHLHRDIADLKHDLKYFESDESEQIDEFGWPKKKEKKDAEPKARDFYYDWLHRSKQGKQG